MTAAQILLAKRDEWYAALLGAWTYASRSWIRGREAEPTRDNGTANVARVANCSALQINMQGSKYGAAFVGIGLIYRDNRWWIASIAWDEETGAGPIPERYRQKP